jgi:hypothetical protein
MLTAFEGEVTMVWGLIRVALFSGSFMAGLFLFGPGTPPVQSKRIERTNSIIHRIHKAPKNSVTRICAAARPASSMPI